MQNYFIFSVVQSIMQSTKEFLCINFFFGYLHQYPDMEINDLL